MKSRPLSVNILDVAVHDTQSNGPAVVFVHGNSHHSGTFRALLNSLPRNALRTIQIDLQGHGASPPATDPDSAYTIPGYARKLVEVTRLLEADDAVFIGHSLGGHVILEALQSLDLARGALLMGAPPVGRPEDLGDAFLPDPGAPAFFKDTMTAEEEVALRIGLEPVSAEFTEEVLSAYAQTDPIARVKLGESIVAGKFSDEKSVITSSPVPIALLAGEDDQLINPAYYDTLPSDNLWLGGALHLPGCGHWAHALPDSRISSLVTRYLWDCLGHA